MRQYILLGVILLLAAASPASGVPQANPGQSSAQTSPATLKNSDIVEMVKAGLSTEIIIAKVQGSPCSFDTSPAALSSLKSSGVPDAVILALVKKSNQPAPNEQRTPPSPSTQPGTRSGATEPAKPASEAPSKGCMAVKPIGSHAFRNIMLGGIAGALVSKQQYQVVDVVEYPARIGQKFHGNDLQTIQSSGTKVVILDKHYKKEDVHKACH